MTWLVLTNASPGATRNSGTNGDLTTLLDWALPQAGWAIEYTSGNARVYRPGSGNRFRLHVNHDSAVSGGAQRAVVRGCEDASAATTLVDPFPLTSQSADTASNWLVSTTASTADRPFIIFLNETFVHYFSCPTSNADQWDWGCFGDVPTNYPSDSYNTIVNVRNAASTTAGVGITQAMATTASGSGGIWWVRDITGATKSSRGILYGSGAGLGSNTGSPAARGGYQNRIYREYVGVTDFASTTTTGSVLSLLKRGWIPGLWNPLHNGRGSVSDVDTFTDTTYNPSAEFRYLSATATAGLIMEITDTWSPP
jgi:hypothetical protein